MYVLLPCSFAGEEFAEEEDEVTGEEEEEEVTGEALAYIAGEEEVAGEEFTGASDRRKEKP